MGQLRGEDPALRIHGRIAPDAVQPDLAHERGARHVGQQVVQADRVGALRVHAHGRREDGVRFRKHLPLRMESSHSCMLLRHAGNVCVPSLA